MRRDLGGLSSVPLGGFNSVGHHYYNCYYSPALLDKQNWAWTQGQTPGSGG